jgi:3-methyladenine DNA glycosylase AlkD
MFVQPSYNSAMDYAEVMAWLEARGSEQTRKTYARHAGGECGPMFGVSWANLYLLQKQLGPDHALAQQLWASGNLDARFLAMLIAEPAQASSSELERWVKEAGNHGMVDEVAKVVGRTPHAPKLAAQWSKAKDELTARAGFATYGQLALAGRLGEDECLALLARIEREIHASPNRLREKMNGVVISIGSTTRRLHDAAIATGERIGPVDIDHGDTHCKTPYAPEYLQNPRIVKKLK